MKRFFTWPGNKKNRDRTWEQNGDNQSKVWFQIWTVMRPDFYSQHAQQSQTYLLRKCATKHPEGIGWQMEDKLMTSWLWIVTELNMWVHFHHHDCLAPTASLANTNQIPPRWWIFHSYHHHSTTQRHQKTVNKCRWSADLQTFIFQSKPDFSFIRSLPACTSTFTHSTHIQPFKHQASSVITPQRPEAHSRAEYSYPRPPPKLP